MSQPRVHPSPVASPRIAATLCALVAAGTWQAPALGDCSLTFTGKVPLNDLGAGTYKGFEGGLYPGGLNSRPPAHEAAAVRRGAEDIRPLNGAGDVDLAGGRIVLVSIGMSNTESEFRTFKSRADADQAKNPKLVIVNGARGGAAAEEWFDADAPTWNGVQSLLESQGLTVRQVQAAWVKIADGSPTFQHGAFPLHAEVLQGYIEQIARNLRTRFPNIKIAYLSSRIRAYTDDPRALNPEPDAYESGFAYKWMIARQIAGEPSLNHDPDRGPVRAPLLSWGPYLWADGTTPRSDGLVWLCSDLNQGDFIHPESGAREKVAQMLLAHFKTDPSSRPWFLRPSGGGELPTVTASADPAAGPAPLTVDFTASASDPDGPITGYAWTFGDGSFSIEPNPTKVFTTPGTFEATITVQDADGNSASHTVSVVVSGDPGPDCNQNGVADALDIAQGTSTDCNENQVPDECDIAGGAEDPCTPEVLIRRGDANNDSRVDISDAIWVLNWMFQGGSEPPCRDAADSNDDGGNDISDAVRILIYFFAPDGQPDLPPLGDCAPDGTFDRLTCNANRCPS